MGKSETTPKNGSLKDKKWTLEADWGSKIVKNRQTSLMDVPYSLSCTTATPPTNNFIPVSIALDQMNSMSAVMTDLCGVAISGPRPLTKGHPMSQLSPYQPFQPLWPQTRWGHLLVVIPHSLHQFPAVTLMLGALCQF